MQGTILGYVISILIAAAVGYLFGSFNGAIVSVRLLKHEDVRKFGSGNAGLTNVLRCFGKTCGICTLIIDLGKGAAAMALAQMICEKLAWAPLPEGNGAMHDYRWLCYVAAIFVVLGHVFPLWHGFRGGKGVLVGVSVFLVINPLTFVILMSVFGIILWRSKYVSLASCTATLCVIPVTLLLERFQRGTDWGTAVLYMVLIAVPAVLVVYSHRENIQRLKNGTERKIGEKKQAPQEPEAENVQIIAMRSNFQNHPMPEEHTELDLEIRLTAEELEKLKCGKLPMTMEDRWFLFYEDDKFYCVRSWTGACIYIADVTDGGEILHAVVNRNPKQYTCTDDEEDRWMLKYLVLWCAGRTEEAAKALDEAVRLSTKGEDEDYGGEA